jgi:hypothetical protein
MGSVMRVSLDTTHLVITLSTPCQPFTTEHIDHTGARFNTRLANSGQGTGSGPMQTALSAEPGQSANIR